VEDVRRPAPDSKPGSGPRTREARANPPVADEGSNMTTMPPKLYYSISEVSEMTGVKPHVLRYWESEFPDLRPKKNRAGNRSYRDKDIKMVSTIRDLLYKQGYTIQGARNQLRDRVRHEEAAAVVANGSFEFPPAQDSDRAREMLRTMKRELQELRKRLD
jgi:DNA-binding transcriptional MerR regulator